jgi:oligosaccharyl transferase complex subunit OST4
MISDSTLYTLSIFLGSLAMLLIVLYHYLEVNARDADDSPTTAGLSDDKIGVGAVKPPGQQGQGQGQQHGRSGNWGKSAATKGKSGSS